MASTVTIHVTASSRGVAGTFARISAQAERMGRRIQASVRRTADAAVSAFGSMAQGALESAVGAFQDLRTAALKLATVGPPLAGLGVVIAGVIGNLTGLASTLPAAILAGAASLVVFKLGLKGVGEAFEAGLSGDVEKFKEAMKGLTREAQDFVAGGLMVAAAWKSVQRAVQSNLFAGLGATLRIVNANLQPLAEKWLPKIASLFNGAARALGGFLSGADAKSGLDTIFAGATRALEGFLSAVPHLARAFTDIGGVGAAMFGDFGQGFGGMAERFSNWIRSLKESGELQAWADRAREAFATLGRIAGDVGRVIASVFKNGSDEGQTFLENIEAQTTKWAEFMESADGAKLVDSLGAIGAAMGHLVGVITFLSQVWLGWVAVYESGIALVSNGWNQMVQMAVSAIGAILAGLVSLLGWIPGIGDRLRGAQRDFEAWRNSSVAALNSTQGAVAGVQSSINNMHGKTIYIDVVQRGPSLGGTGGYRGLASGGIATGMKWVGERGPELVDFGAAGGRVKNAGASREMTRQGGGGGGGSQSININVSAGSGSTTFTDFFLGELRAGRIKMTVNSAGRVAVA